MTDKSIYFQFKLLLELVKLNDNTSDSFTLIKK